MNCKTWPNFEYTERFPSDMALATYQVTNFKEEVVLQNEDTLRKKNLTFKRGRRAIFLPKRTEGVFNS